VRSLSSPRALCTPNAGVGSNTWAGSTRVGPRRPSHPILWLGHSKPSARFARGPSSVSAEKPFKN
jgi:hypothetical protein